MLAMTQVHANTSVFAKIRSDKELPSRHGAETLDEPQDVLNKLIFEETLSHSGNNPKPSTTKPQGSIRLHIEL